MVYSCVPPTPTSNPLTPKAIGGDSEMKRFPTRLRDQYAILVRHDRDISGEGKKLRAEEFVGGGECDKAPRRHHPWSSRGGELDVDLYSCQICRVCSTALTTLGQLCLIRKVQLQNSVIS